jgi:uncharacterized protein
MMLRRTGHHKGHHGHNEIWISVVSVVSVVVINGVLATAAVTLPKPAGYVSDFANILDAGTRTRLDQIVRDTERTTGTEIAVATVTSLDGVSVEEYANRLFHTWGIGKKGSDNGVLILVAPKERTMRIEVGYGLEPILPDGLAGEIVRTVFLPAFQRGDYPAGILAGTQRVADIVRRGEPAPASPRRTRGNERRGIPPLWFAIPFLSLFVLIGSFFGGVGLRTRTGGAIVFALLFCAVPLFFVIALRHVAAVWIVPTLGLVAFVLGFRRGGSDYWRQAIRGPMRAGDDSTAWTMGGMVSGGGSDDSGSSSGGDFGGGDSGGGGASGSW